RGRPSPHRRPGRSSPPRSRPGGPGRGGNRRDDGPRLSSSRQPASAYAPPPPLPPPPGDRAERGIAGDEEPVKKAHRPHNRGILGGFRPSALLLAFVPEHAAGEGVGGLALADRRLTVDEQVADAGGVLVRLVVRRLVAELLRVEDHDVGEVAAFQITPLR